MFFYVFIRNIWYFNNKSIRYRKKVFFFFFFFFKKNLLIFIIIHNFFKQKFIPFITVTVCSDPNNMSLHDYLFLFSGAAMGPTGLFAIANVCII